MLPLLAVPDDPPPGVEDLWFMLHVLFERMRDYRFLYRDLDEITSRNRKLALRVADLVRRLDRTVVELCRSLVRTGEMHASEREIGALAANATLVSTTGCRGSASSACRRVRATRRGEVSLDHAAYHVLALIAPFLAGRRPRADRAPRRRLPVVGSS